MDSTESSLLEERSLHETGIDGIIWGSRFLEIFRKPLRERPIIQCVTIIPGKMKKCICINMHSAGAYILHPLDSTDDLRTWFPAWDFSSSNEVDNVAELGLAPFIEDASNCRQILDVLLPCNPPTVLERARGKLRASPATPDSASDGGRLGVRAPPNPRGIQITNQIYHPSNVSSSNREMTESTDGIIDIESQLSSRGPSAGNDLIGGFDDNAQDPSNSHSPTRDGKGVLGGKGGFVGEFYNGNVYGIGFENAQDPSSSRGPRAGKGALGGKDGSVGGFCNGNVCGRGFDDNAEDPSSSRGPSDFDGNVSSERGVYNAQNICFGIKNPKFVYMKRMFSNIHHFVSQKLRELDDAYYGKLAELGVGICAAAVYSLSVQASNGPVSLGLKCAAGVNAVGFICNFTHILLRGKKPEVSAIAGIIGVSAMAIAVLLGLGMVLPAKYVCIIAIAFLIPTVAFLFG